MINHENALVSFYLLKVHNHGTYIIRLFFIYSKIDRPKTTETSANTALVPIVHKSLVPAIAYPNKMAKDISPTELLKIYVKRVKLNGCRFHAKQLFSSGKQLFKAF